LTVPLAIISALQLGVAQLHVVGLVVISAFYLSSDVVAMTLVASRFGFAVLTGRSGTGAPCREDERISGSVEYKHHKLEIKVSKLSASAYGSKV